MQWQRWAIMAVLVASASAFVVLTSRSRPQIIVGVAPVDRDLAVLVTLREAVEDDYSVQLTRADGTVAWSVRTEDHHVLTSTGETAVVGDDRAVYTFEEPIMDAPPVTRLVARALADGAELWRRDVDALPRDRIVTFGLGGLHVDDERVYLTRVLSDAAWLDAFARADGEHAWGPVELGPNGPTVRTFGADRLVALAHLAQHSVLVERSSGDASPLARAHPLGEVDGAQVVVSGGEPTILAPDGPPVRLHAAELGLVGERYGPMGVRAGRVVLGARRSSGRGLALAAFDRARGASAWSVELTAHLFLPHASDGGALPRMFPIALFSDPGGDLDEHRLAVVDLDRGAVVARFVAGKRGLIALTARDRPYVWLEPDTLVAFAPDTGAIASATRLSGATRAALHRTEQLRHGQLWIVGDTAALPDALPYAVVDLATGEVTHTNGAMTAVDVTGSVTGLLTPVTAFVEE